jgi:acyl carrier protein
MNTAVGARVRCILADILSIARETITPESSPETLETWDSLQHLNLVLAVEQEFGVQFKPEEIEKLSSVKLVVQTLEMKLANRS